MKTFYIVDSLGLFFFLHHLDVISGSLIIGEAFFFLLNRCLLNLGLSGGRGEIAHRGAFSLAVPVICFFASLPVLNRIRFQLIQFLFCKIK